MRGPIHGAVLCRPAGGRAVGTSTGRIMPAHILIAGGGIAGLASAVALAQRGHRVDVLEKASAFTEIGAGVQLGPNVTRRLATLGLEVALRAAAAQPRLLVVRSAGDGRELARMALGRDIEQRYGAPYLCVHRADLHGVLRAAVQASGLAALTARARITRVRSRHRPGPAGQRRRARLGGRRAGRCRRPLEHGARTGANRRRAAARHRPHGLARAGAAVRPAGRAAAHQYRGLARPAAACRLLPGARRRSAQRGGAGRVRRDLRYARLGPANQPGRAAEVPPAASAANCRRCSKPCRRGARGH